MEKISLTSAILDCHLEVFNWLEFVEQGHSITYRDPQSGSLPFKPSCPACQRKSVHSQENKREFHAQDQIFCLNLFTPGTDPDQWADTGIQAIRVQAPTKEEVIKLMQQSIVDTIFAFARQEHAKQFQQSQLDRMKMTMDQVHMFITGNETVPEGQTPVDLAMRIVRQSLLHQHGLTELPTDKNELLPLSWRRK